MNNSSWGDQLKRDYHRRSVLRACDADQEDTVIEITLRDPDGSLMKFLEDLKGRANVGHSFSVVVDPRDERQAKFFFDGDGPFFIKDVKKKA